MADDVRAAVLGSPVSHSLSPVLHRAAYAALGLTTWAYTAIECDEARLPRFLATLDATWAGLSLTMPLKRAVLPLLDEIDPLAADVGGANTVVFAGRRRHGYNTDVGGMVDALGCAGVASCDSALVIGAGATACSALAAVRQLGARKVTVAVRDTDRAGALTAAAGRLGVAVDLHELELAGTGARVLGTAAAARLVICTVPAHAADGLARSFDHLTAGPPAVVLDVAYEPWPTMLAAAAAAVGSTVVGGFDLLLHQAAHQVELMTGHQAPLAAMRRAGLAELTTRQAARKAPVRNDLTA